MPSDRVRYIETTIAAIAELELRLKEVAGDLLTLHHVIMEWENKQAVGKQVSGLDFNHVSNVCGVTETSAKDALVAMRDSESIPNNVIINDDMLIGWIFSEMHNSI